MLRRILHSIRSSHVSQDVRRLVRGHGSEALFIARHAVFASREAGRLGYWSRVLKAVETQSSYRPF